MKKPVIFALLLVFLLCGCGQSAVPREAEDSQLFTQREIRAAMDAAERLFERQFGRHDCTLLSMSYDENVTEREQKSSSSRKEDDVIVILVDFHTGEGYDLPGALSPGQTYKNYHIVLSRGFFGTWLTRGSGFA